MRPAPLKGEHTVEILSELGLSDAEIQDLCDAGAAITLTEQTKSV